MSVRAAEAVQVSSAEDTDDIWHIVCHCTNDDTAACGLDCTTAVWSDDGDEAVCPLCRLVWPIDAPMCPWGCGCDECAPPPP